MICLTVCFLEWVRLKTTSIPLTVSGHIFTAFASESICLAQMSPSLSGHWSLGIVFSELLTLRLCYLSSSGCSSCSREAPSCREISLALRLCVRAQSFQACLTLCDPMGCSPSGSSVHGILQARIVEWVAMTSSRGSSLPRDWTSSVSYVHLHWQVVSLPLAPSANGKNHCSQWIQ